MLHPCSILTIGSYSHVIRCKMFLVPKGRDQRGSRKKGLDFFEVPVHGGEGKGLSWAFSEVQWLSLVLTVHAGCLLAPGDPARRCFPSSIIQEGQGGSGELRAGRLRVLEDVFRHIKDTKYLGTASRDLPSVPDQLNYLP